MEFSIIFLIIVLILSFSVICVSAYSYNQSHTCIVSDSSSEYFLSYSGSNADITAYNDEVKNYSLSFENNISGICAFNGNIAALCNDFANNQLLVYTCDLNTGYPDSFAIYGQILNSSTDYCCDYDGIYIEDCSNQTVLNKYSFSGELLYSFTFDSGVTCAVNGFDGGAYVSTNQALYYISDNSCTEIYGAVPTPLYPASDDVLASAQGKVYSLDGNSAEEFDVDCDYNALSACRIGYTVYYPCGRMIYGYNEFNGTKTYSYETDFEVKILYSVGKTVVAANPITGEICYIEPKSIQSTAEHPRDPGSQNNGNSAYYNYSSTELYSDIYKIDFENGYISGIPVGTTVAQFKDNLSFSGYNLSIFSGGEEKTSGNIGSSMILNAENDSDRFSFELVVTGDLTGEGNMNSRDLNMLMDTMINEASISGAYELAADLSDDGKVDVVDLAMMKRAID